MKIKLPKPSNFIPSPINIVGAGIGIPPGGSTTLGINQGDVGQSPRPVTSSGQVSVNAPTGDALTNPQFIVSRAPSLDYLNAWSGSYSGQTASLRVGDIAAGAANNDFLKMVALDVINHGIPADASLSDLRNKSGDANFIAQYGLGTTQSYMDMAKQAVAADVSIDPNDMATITKFAQQIKDRGLKPADTGKIGELATSFSQKLALDKAQHPENYLTEDQRAGNLGTANDLIKTIYGADYQDNQGLGKYLADEIAKGMSPYEVSQFLKTTPEYMQMQTDKENARVSTEAAAARDALNQELLKSQQEVFSKATPSIVASYMRAGRLNSSGLNSALAKAQQDLESQRQSFLANAAYDTSIRQQGYNRQDFVNGQNAAYQQYLRQNNPAYQQQLNLQGASNYLNYQFPFQQLNRQYQLADQSTARAQELQDFMTQYSLWKQYQDENKPNPWIGALRGAMGGAGTGASLGGGWGALGGAVVGGVGGYNAYR